MPNALDAAVPLDREAARRELGLPADATVVGWVGRFSPEKDPQLFLRAFATLRRAEATRVDGARGDVLAVLIGDGPEMHACRQLADELDIASCCVFPGMMRDAGRLFRAFDLFVMSSQTEGTPVAALEAMRAEVAVVATAVGGVPQVLRDDAGWLVPPGDDAQLAVQMANALDDDDDRRRRVLLARRRLHDEFGMTTWLDTHLSLYTDVLQDRSSGGT